MTATCSSRAASTGLASTSSQSADSRALLMAGHLHVRTCYCQSLPVPELQVPLSSHSIVFGCTGVLPQHASHSHACPGSCPGMREGVLHAVLFRVAEMGHPNPEVWFALPAWRGSWNWRRSVCCCQCIPASTAASVSQKPMKAGTGRRTRESGRSRFDGRGSAAMIG